MTGEWGCGKTYFVEHTLKEALDSTHIIIRISLFGVSRTEEIVKKIKKGWLDAKGSIWGQISSIQEKLAPVEAPRKKLFNLSRLSGHKNKLELIDSLISVDFLEFVNVENTVNNKKAVLVFDDLERSNLGTVEILGIINEYCENKHFNVIIIAHDQKIKDSERNTHGEGKLSFEEIKEKVIQKTLCFKMEYDKIVQSVIDEMTRDKIEYRGFWPFTKYSG